jgi:hypothetical protein
MNSYLMSLKKNGPDPRWMAMCELTNTSLEAFEARIEFDRVKAEKGVYRKYFEAVEPISDEDLTKVRKAIELRKGVDRRLKRIEEVKDLNAGGS